MSIDRDALIEAMHDARLFATIRENVWACDEENFGATMRPIYDAAIDAILPAVEQAIREARAENERLRAEVSLLRADVEILRAGAVPITDDDLDHFESGVQEGREQAAQAIEAKIHCRIDSFGEQYQADMFDYAARLARGGTTDEEQTP